MVVVVADPVLVKRWGAGGLNSSDQTLFGKEPKRVVDSLFGNGPDLGKNRFHDFIRPAMRILGNRPQDSQPLGGDLNSMLSKERGRIQHVCTVYQFLDSVNYW